ncbi:MAG: rRNA methyltransferase [Bacteroidetes bacterium MedPE-SWsnd-G2]|nr:MAG: rRNA methyltransferase [Bacteroidetes bacterium MedPE-SWsnd-G2]
MKQIFSVQNQEVKRLVTLKEKSRNRKKSGQFLIEGLRELSIAIKGNYQIESILFHPEICSQDQIAKIHPEHTQLIEISKDVFQKLAYRESTEGIIAVANCKEHHISNASLNVSTPLILVAEAPEKPGNIGALLRTADAANFDMVIIANPKTDLYNPNIIRSSVGCVFTNNIAMGTTTEIINFLKSNSINIFCAALQASSRYDLQDYTGPSAIVVGTEATGLSQEWRDHSTQNIIIPMLGVIDSMNVSVAAGILMYEAKRQRQFQ